MGRCEKEEEDKAANSRRRRESGERNKWKEMEE